MNHAPEKEKMRSPEPEVGFGEVVNLGCSTQPQWARFIPGPRPESRLRNLSPATMRYGVTTCGCVVMMLSGYSELDLSKKLKHMNPDLRA